MWKDIIKYGRTKYYGIITMFLDMYNECVMVFLEVH